MKFNRVALLEAIDRSIEKEQIALTDADNAAMVMYEEAKHDWLHSKKPEKLRIAAQRVVTLVDKGELVVKSDLTPLQTSRYDGGSHHFSMDKPKPIQQNTCNPTIKKLEALRDFLQLATDEDVTTNGLNESGFRNIGALLNSVACA